MFWKTFRVGFRTQTMPLTRSISCWRFWIVAGWSSWLRQKVSSIKIIAYEVAVFYLTYTTLCMCRTRGNGLHSLATSLCTNAQWNTRACILPVSTNSTRCNKININYCVSVISKHRAIHVCIVAVSYIQWIVTVAQQCVSIGTIANLLSSILTILLTCPNNDTVLCYSNDRFWTVYVICNIFAIVVSVWIIWICVYSI